MSTFTCFGEVLWDVFPDKEKIGGAPLNVALRLKSFEDKTNIISAIGKDAYGDKLIRYLHSKKIDSKFIQIDPNHPTGRVNVTLDRGGSATYEIEFPAAWDHIPLTEENILLVKQTDVFVFGSLICRNLVSRDTLFELLQFAKFKVFDVNLRPPFYTQELLNDLMKQASFIKFNEEELLLIAKNLGSKFTSIEENIKFIARTFKTEFVCVTKGAQGAVLLLKGRLFNHKGYKATVKDTVGAGDSFLASLIFKLTSGAGPQDALDYACAVGALVIGYEGANPDILDEDILGMLSN
jgi:fructokinase